MEERETKRNREGGREREMGFFDRRHNALNLQRDAPSGDTMEQVRSLLPFPHGDEESHQVLCVLHCAHSRCVG